MSQYLIGIDGGGTQTQAVVVNEMLEVLGRAATGPSNHYAVGAEQAAAHCEQATEAVLADARRVVPGLTREDIAAWGLGLAGVRRDNDAALMRTHLKDLAGERPWILDTDVAAAHAGAFTGGPGVVLSAGTGAICFGMDEHGERFYADGWGPILGDEGSGHWIGLEALRAVCRDADGRGPRTRLSGSVLQTLALRDCDDLVRSMYNARLGREHIAHLARIVLDVAEAGDQGAISIRERAVAHLGNSVSAVVRAMLTRARERSMSRAPAPQEIVIALRGGLFEDDFFRATVGYNIGERIFEIKRDYLPLGAWRIVRPQFEAAVGAALMARQLVL